MYIYVHITKLPKKETQKTAYILDINQLNCFFENMAPRVLTQLLFYPVVYSTLVDTYYGSKGCGVFKQGVQN